jgi:hypothetical protein
MSNHECTKEKDITALFERCRTVDSHTEQIKTLQENHLTLIVAINELKHDIKELTLKLANRLPGWATLIITALTSILTGVTVYNLTH